MLFIFWNIFLPRTGQTISHTMLVTYYTQRCYHIDIITMTWIRWRMTITSEEISQTEHTNASVRAGGRRKVSHNLPAVHLRVISLYTLQIRPLRVWISTRYVDASVYYCSATLHPSLLHLCHLPPFILFGVVTVCDSGLTADQVQFIV